MQFPSFFTVFEITVKVSFKIVSDASFIYILSRQNLIKNAKSGPIWRVFENLKLAVIPCYQTLIEQKILEKAQIEKFICDILRHFQTL